MKNCVSIELAKTDVTKNVHFPCVQKKSDKKIVKRHFDEL